MNDYQQITKDDLNIAIDALNGNKDAIINLLKKANVSPIDLLLDDNYNEEAIIPKYIFNHNIDETVLEIKAIFEEIGNEPEFTVTENIIANQWDKQSLQTFRENPKLIFLLHQDVKTGLFDKLAPIMNKLKIYDGAELPDIEYYKEAANQYFKGNIS